MPAKPCKLGRAHDCDILVNHTSVSRHHCVVTLTGDGLRVEDLGSSYGTFVNGEQITDYTAKLGDEIRFGRIPFVYEAKPSASVAVTPLPIVEDREGEPRMTVKPEGDEADAEMLEHACHSCGATIQFPAESVGEKIDCAACGQALVLGAVVAKKRQKRRPNTTSGTVPVAPVPPQGSLAKAAVPVVAPVEVKSGLPTAALVGIVVVIVGVLAGGGIWFINRGGESNTVVSNITGETPNNPADRNADEVVEANTNAPNPTVITNVTLPAKPAVSDVEAPSNVVAIVTNTVETNAVAVPAVASGPPPPVKDMIVPLPENETRTFVLKTDEEITGRVFSVRTNGVVIKRESGAFTLRIPFEKFAAEIEWEPKVIAFRAEQIAREKEDEERRIAAIKAAAEAKAKAEVAEAERAQAMAARRASLDRTLDTAIRIHGTSVVRRGYLRAWGSNVTIGEIFEVVAPSASWTASKVAETDSQRYSHYLVEATWRNDSLDRVNMQYLVDTIGDFRLHGCFINGKNVPDSQFILIVKEIWNEKR